MQQVTVCERPGSCVPRKTGVKAGTHLISICTFHVQFMVSRSSMQVDSCAMHVWSWGANLIKLLIGLLVHQCKISLGSTNLTKSVNRLCATPRPLPLLPHVHDVCAVFGLRAHVAAPPARVSELGPGLGGWFEVLQVVLQCPLQVVHIVGKCTCIVWVLFESIMR